MRSSKLISMSRSKGRLMGAGVTAVAAAAAKTIKSETTRRENFIVAPILL
jgi:hypothetical protein